MRFNRSVFVSFLLSYLLLMGLVIAVFAAFLTGSFAERKEELRIAHENTLTRACESISQELDRTLTLIDGYTTSTRVGMLLGMQDVRDAHTREKILEFYHVISDSIKGQNLYRRIAFRFDRMDRIIADNGTSETSAYYQVYYRQLFDTYDAWIAWMQQMRLGQLYPCRDGSVYIGTTLPLLEANQNRGAMLVQLNEQALFASLLSAQDLFSGAIEVCDPQGNVIYTLGNAQLLRDGQAVYSFEVRDGAGRFFLRSAVEEEFLFADASDALRFYLLVLAVCVLLGVIVSLVMSARFYQPVRRIATLVGGDARDENELQSIEQSIQSIMDERERLNSSLMVHSDDLLQCEFRRIINGEANEAQAQELIERELAPGEQGLVSFVAVCAEGMKARRACELMETILARSLRCRCFTTGRLAAGVVTGGDYSAIREQMQALYNQMERLCGGTLCMAVSEMVYAPLALAIAHRQALDTLDYGMVANGRGVIFADRLPETSDEADSGITLYDHLRLQDAIRSGDADEAVRTFQWMTEKYFPEEGAALPLLKCRMFSLINTLIASASELRSEHQAEPPIEQLLGCHSVDDMIREAGRYLQTVCSRMKRDSQLQSPSSQRDQIMEYIRAHHQDVNLNVASIAAHFEISASYLSRLFKQSSGEGVLDTIHVVRLMHVKQLLRETDMPMHEIRVSTGYPSEQTMFRAFKRIEGMTPSQYRQLYRQDAQHDA